MSIGAKAVGEERKCMSMSAQGEFRISISGIAVTREGYFVRNEAFTCMT